MSGPQEMEWDMFLSCQGEDVCDACLLSRDNLPGTPQRGLGMRSPRRCGCTGDRVPSCACGSSQPPPSLEKETPLAGPTAPLNVRLLDKKSVCCLLLPGAQGPPHLDPAQTLFEAPVHMGRAPRSAEGRRRSALTL